jgi:hypothetical protein
MDPVYAEVIKQFVLMVSVEGGLLALLSLEGLASSLEASVEVQYWYFLFPSQLQCFCFFRNTLARIVQLLLNFVSAALAAHLQVSRGAACRRGQSRVKHCV